MIQEAVANVPDGATKYSSHPYAYPMLQIDISHVVLANSRGGRWSRPVVFPSQVLLYSAPIQSLGPLCAAWRDVLSPAQQFYLRSRVRRYCFLWPRSRIPLVFRSNGFSNMCMIFIQLFFKTTDPNSSSRPNLHTSPRRCPAIYGPGTGPGDNSPAAVRSNRPVAAGTLLVDSLPAGTLLAALAVGSIPSAGSGSTGRFRPGCRPLGVGRRRLDMRVAGVEGRLVRRYRPEVRRIYETFFLSLSFPKWMNVIVFSSG